MLKLSKSNGYRVRKTCLSFERSSDYALVFIKTKVTMTTETTTTTTTTKAIRIITVMTTIITRKLTIGIRT